MLEQNFDLPRATQFPVQLAGAKQNATFFVGDFRFMHTDVPLPVVVQPLLLQRHLHTQAHADEITLFVFVFLYCFQQTFNFFFHPAENGCQVVVIVTGNFRRTALRIENRKLSHNTA